MLSFVMQWNISLAPASSTKRLASMRTFHVHRFHSERSSRHRDKSRLILSIAAPCFGQSAAAIWRKPQVVLSGGHLTRQGAPMDRAPSLQDSPRETRNQPALQGTGIDYKEIAREVLARIDQRLVDLGADTPPDPSEAQFHAETAGGIMSSDDQAALVRWAWRGLIGLLLSASLVAAISFLWSNHETATPSVAQSVPRFDLGSTTPAEKPEPGPPTTPKAIADAVPAPVLPAPVLPAPVLPAPAVPAPRTALDKPNPAPVPPELAELMRKVDRNIAGLAQAVTELRLAHQQTTGDNARTVADIRASLDQMAQAVATATASEAREAEQVPQAKPPAQVTQAKPPAQVTQAKPPAQVTQAKPPAQVTQAKPPVPQTAARRNRGYVPPYLSPSDAMGYMR
jgi:hypothetical protein